MGCDSPRCDNRYYCCTVIFVIVLVFCFFFFSFSLQTFQSAFRIPSGQVVVFNENKTTTNNALTECAHSARADTDTDTVALRQIQLQIQRQIVRGQNNFEMHLRRADKLLNTCQGGADKRRIFWRLG